MCNVEQRKVENGALDGCDLTLGSRTDADILGSALICHDCLQLEGSVLGPHLSSRERLEGDTPHRRESRWEPVMDCGLTWVEDSLAQRVHLVPLHLRATVAAGGPIVRHVIASCGDSWVRAPPQYDDRVMRIGLLSAIVGVSLLAWHGVPYLREFNAVDQCLDAGGSFDYSNGACDHRDSHRYIAYSTRHPAAAPVASVGAAVALTGCALILKRRR